MKVIQPEQIGIYLSAAEEWGVLPMFYLELTSGLRVVNCWHSSGQTWTQKTVQSP